jgi:hypothetical protein
MVSSILIFVNGLGLARSAEFSGRHRMSLRPPTSPTSADVLFNNLGYARPGRKTRISGRVQIDSADVLIAHFFWPELENI